MASCVVCNETAETADQRALDEPTENEANKGSLRDRLKEVLEVDEIQNGWMCAPCQNDLAQIELYFPQLTNFRRRYWETYQQKYVDESKQFAKSLIMTGTSLTAPLTSINTKIKTEVWDEANVMFEDGTSNAATDSTEFSVGKDIGAICKSELRYTKHDGLDDKMSLGLRTRNGTPRNVLTKAKVNYREVNSDDDIDSNEDTDNEDNYSAMEIIDNDMGAAEDPEYKPDIIRDSRLVFLYPKDTNLDEILESNDHGDLDGGTQEHDEFLDSPEASPKKLRKVGSCTCAICDKRFRSAAHLKRHSLIHRTDRPFKCDICQKTYKDSATLKEHMERHSLKGTPCPICGFVFNAENDMRKHKKKMHLGVEEALDEGLGNNEVSISEAVNQAVDATCYNTDAGYQVEPTGEADQNVIVQELSGRLRHNYCSVCKKHFRKAAPHICVTCGKHCKGPAHLESHQRAHTEDRPFTCDQCGKAFKDPSSLKEHIGRHSEVGHPCVLCNKVYSSRGELNKHKRKKHPDVDKALFLKKPEKKAGDEGDLSMLPTENNATENLKHYYCETCKRQFRAHVKHVCHICWKHFAVPGRLERHMYMHTGEKPYACEKCGKTFRESKTLKEHIERHLGLRFQCPVCGVSYSSKGDMLKHKRKKHVLWQIFEADKMAAKSEMPEGDCQPTDGGSQPVTSLEGEPNFQKERSPKGKGYDCSECGKNFRTPAHLKRHMTVHTGDRPFLCNVCGKTFKDDSCLKVHLTVHTDQRFPCPVCSATYSSRSEMLKHKRKKHPETVIRRKPSNNGEDHEINFSEVNQLDTTENVLNLISMDPDEGEEDIGDSLTDHSPKTNGDHLCVVCNKSFKTAARLKIHLRVHTGERPFWCNICGKGFIEFRHLQRHETTHRDSTDFACDQCGQVFKKKDALEDHHVQVHGYENDSELLRAVSTSVVAQFENEMHYQ